MKSTLPIFAILAATNVFAQQAEFNNQDTKNAGDFSVNAPETAKTPRITNQPLNQTNNGNVDAINGNVMNSRIDAKDNGQVGKYYPNQKPEKSEFQSFIQYATGKKLTQFGSDFFSNTPSSFAPVQNTPLPSDYILGAGDEVMIRAWGSVDIDYKATVDRNGTINIPTIGTVTLVGVRAADADTVIKSSISRLYRDVAVSVTYGRLRAITVYVVGQAKKPGSYTVSGFSTLVTALLASGGPNAVGSMRNVQVKRDGKLVGSLDLYAFIAKGDKSHDVKLLDGDTIYIPPASAHIALVGKVNTPAIYELKSPNETLSSILDIAGGLPVVADPRRAFLERIDPNKSQPRSVEEFNLNRVGLNKTLKDGDILSVSSITPEFSNAVTLRGNVSQQIRVPFTPGMRVRDLIPNRAMLVTPSSVARQNLEGKNINDAIELSADDDQVRLQGKTQEVNSIAARIGSQVDEVNWEYAAVERINHETQVVSLVSFNLGKAMDDVNSPENIVLQAGDTVTIFSQNDIQVPLAKRKVFVRVEGEVNVPGVYQMSPGETLPSLIAKAGGTTSNAYLFGTEFYREQVRKEQQANLEKAIRRLESQMRSENAKAVANDSGGQDAATVAAKLKVAQESSALAIAKMHELKATGRISFGLGADDDSFDKLPPLKLENGDQLVIPSRPDFIHVFGAVNQESSMIWQRGSTVDRYLEVAGPTSEADMDNIFVLRANGTVLSSTGRGWFSSVKSSKLMPGDSIVVPERLNKESAYKTFTNGLKDWAQILSGFGISAAAIKSLRQ
ncbi:SLBB domain-containing protein [Undibacterium sp. MH2W]|uniref:polysaccharide biosynthesis/export family protein n=1 Tax=Undibacterium sp. MH2W TaxID=3413044 RepID=UPI003BF073C7